MNGKKERVNAYKLTITCATFVVLLAAPYKAAWSADETVGVALDSIVVTAQKREQDSQDVGISITSLSSTQLEATNVSAAKEIPTFVPGLQLVQPNGAGSYSFSVRGVTQNDTAEHQESPTAIYVDEAYVSQMSGLAMQLFDMERVEILRGPQGTLFGRNATGGLAHFISRRPTENTNGYLKATVGEYNLVRTEGAIGGKLFGNANVLGRLAFTTNNHDGLFENTTTGRDSENGNDKAIRGQLLYNLSDVFSLLIIGRYANKIIRAGAWESTPLTLGADGYGVLGASANLFGFGASGSFKTEGDAKGYAKINSSGLTAKFDTFIDAFNNAQLTTIVDYQNHIKQYLEDSDTTPLPIAHVFNTSSVDQYSAEFRLAGQKDTLNWIGGLYYLNINGKYTQGAEGVAMGGLIDPYSQKTESYAVFGQADFALTEQLGLTLGARYTIDKKNFNFISTIAGNNVYEYSKATVGDLATINDGFWTDKIGLNYKLSPATLLYASYSRGVKSGGFNAPIAPTLSPPPTDAMSFKNETLDAYEIGSKNEFWQHKARLNSTLFYYDYKNSQAYNLFGLTTLITNAPARHMGGEIELQLSPDNHWLFGLGISYLDAIVKDINFGQGSRNFKPSNAPRWSVNALARYSWSLDTGVVDFQLDGKAQSSQYFMLSNSPVAQQSGYGLMNARAHFTTLDKKYELGFDVINIFDKNYAVMTFDGASTFGLQQRYPGNPRWASVTVKYNLD